jgi:hypothetical protein
VQAEVFELCGRLATQYMAIQLKAASTSHARHQAGPLACMEHDELHHWLQQVALALMANAAGALRTLLPQARETDEGNSGVKVRQESV